MEQLDLPDRKTWEERNDWINSMLFERSERGSYLVSDQATALLVDLQACYCVGAWLSVIILSISIIDAQLRETEACDNEIGTAKLLTEYYSGKGDINWLRKLRNKYVHINIEKPALCIDDQHLNRNKMQQDARKAIEMVIDTFFQSPGT